MRRKLGLIVIAGLLAMASVGLKTPDNSHNRVCWVQDGADVCGTLAQFRIAPTPIGTIATRQKGS
jgi:hypothetical protein